MAYTTLSQAGIDFSKTYAVATAVTATSGLDVPSPPWAVGTMELGSLGSEWVFCIAGGTIAAGDFVVLTTPSSFTVAAVTNTNGLAGFGSWVGVAGGAVTVGQFLWVQRSGYASSANVATSATAFAALHTTTTAGRLNSSGTANTTATVSGVVGTAAAASNTAPVIMSRSIIGVLD